MHSGILREDFVHLLNRERLRRTEMDANGQFLINDIVDELLKCPPYCPSHFQIGLQFTDPACPELIKDEDSLDSEDRYNCDKKEQY
jgi:hypothetical protein